MELNLIRKMMKAKVILLFTLLAFSVTLTGTGLTACSTDDTGPQAEIPAIPDENTGNNDQDNENNNNMKIQVKIGSNTYTATLADNPTAVAFRAMLPLTLNMGDVNRNEKFIQLPNSLPVTASNPGTIRTGDLMLYGAAGLVLFYKTFSTSYSYTRIGTLDNASGLESVLGTGSVTVTFEDADE